MSLPKGNTTIRLRRVGAPRVFVNGVQMIGVCGVEVTSRDGSGEVIIRVLPNHVQMNTRPDGERPDK